MPTVINLAATCRTLRSSILPLRDEVAQKCIQNHHGWMLPLTPRDKRVWIDKIEALRDSSGVAEEKKVSVKVQSIMMLLTKRLYLSFAQLSIPWISYYRLCVEDDGSMRNRKRIFDITQLITSDLIEQGLLEPVAQRPKRNRLKRVHSDNCDSK